MSKSKVLRAVDRRRALWPGDYRSSTLTPTGDKCSLQVLRSQCYKEFTHTQILLGTYIPLVKDNLFEVWIEEKLTGSLI